MTGKTIFIFMSDLNTHQLFSKGNKLGSKSRLT